MTQNKKYWNEEMETLSPEMFSGIQEERLMKNWIMFGNTLCYIRKSIVQQALSVRT